ncbi:MAG TPA: hypothetical protein VEK10_12840 [Steroidobacteraceae bacterium]|nr:hypothetical protein [Steroidobacteraceae bacterium]
MSLRTVLVITLAALGLWQGYDNWQLRAVHPPDGPVAPDDPKQTDVGEEPVTTLGRWRLTPRARYDITARILSREDYHFDLLSDLIPEDLALGWGPMSDNRVLRAFEITQGARFYTWAPKQALPIPRQAVIEHSANTHVIPADAGVRRQLARLRVGQVVHLTGFLVNAMRDDGAYINTSMTRSDSGPGSCEVVLVEQVEAW